LVVVVVRRVSMTDSGASGPAGNRTDDFVSRLADLKERGGAVLVVGGGSREVHATACRRLMGDESAGVRHRLLVFTNGTFAVDPRIPQGAERLGDTTVITAAATRSAVAKGVASSDLNVVELDGASLAELGGSIVDAVGRIEDRHGPLEPTQLRIGIDSLSALLDAHGERAVFQFLVVATRYVRSVDGLGHFHLPVDREAYVARLLAPLFDAVVEVRVRSGRSEQRWHLDDGAVTSQWLSI
jgi:hypothetical protein